MTTHTDISLTFPAMACEGTVRLGGAPAAVLAKAAQAAQAEVCRIEAKYSRYRPDSVTRILRSAAGGGWVDVDAETQSLLDYADALWQQSGGLFDITAGVLRRAWNFQARHLPTPETVDTCLPFIGWDRIQRRPGQVRLPAGMEIDFGGIGKEYAADRAAALAKAHGAEVGWVNLGGDISVIGSDQASPAVRGWDIGIAHPRPEHPGHMLAHVALSRGGLATSGDSERYIEVDGQRHCHILNPRTGWPVRYWQSVSVVAASATAAGSLSTIAMLKEAQAVGWLQAQHVQFLAVDALGRVVQHVPGQASPGGAVGACISLSA